MLLVAAWSAVHLTRFARKGASSVVLRHRCEAPHAFSRILLTELDVNFGSGVERRVIPFPVAILTHSRTILAHLVDVASGGDSLRR
ncbi:hypothetical protein [Microbacterium azadirachtae]|uniref:hypothetical protein n=1 Tax=Microbacterium azadirachtae TaxID=582680 RepID=UPI0012E0BA8A|nr:hypothetical protein [Microbacterium azadirachtae]UXW86688.1 hypothetical protein NFX31_03910 [Microbacterium azadirachtae]